MAKRKIKKAKKKTVRKLSKKCRIWCPECNKYFGSYADEAACIAAADNHNKGYNPNHTADCECKQKGK